MINKKIKDYLLLYFSFFIYSFVSVFAKLASEQSSVIAIFVFIGIEIAFLAMYALLWQQALKKFPLMIAMSNKGITVILALIWSIAIFQESISIYNIIGTVMIIIGIWMVSIDE